KGKGGRCGEYGEARCEELLWVQHRHRWNSKASPCPRQGEETGKGRGNRCRRGVQSLCRGDAPSRLLGGRGVRKEPASCNSSPRRAGTKVPRYDSESFSNRDGRYSEARRNRYTLQRRTDRWKRGRGTEGTLCPPEGRPSRL